jgi:arylsulfatase A-like enzyme
MISDSPANLFSRRDFLKAGSALSLSAFFQQSSAAPKGTLSGGLHPPNLLFLNLDQLSHMALSCHGNPYVKTPHIDRLAKRSIDFSKSYTPDPICCPARASWCTGRFPSENNVAANNRRLRQDLPDYGQWLGQNGYQTVHIGKWHVPGRPLHQSFQLVPHNSHPQGEYSDNLVALSFEAFLENRDRSRPFFAQVGLMNPHDIGNATRTAEHPFPFPHLQDQLPPYPPNFDYDPREPEQIAFFHEGLVDWLKPWTEENWGHYQWLYYRMVEMVDINVGYILDTLEQSPDYENTVLIFTSDHGEANGYHRMLFKDNFYDTSSRVPTMVSFPGHIPEGIEDVEHLVSGLDFFPTFCDYAGIDSPSGLKGLSLRPLLEGDRKPATWRRYLHAQSKASGRMVVDQQYKFIRYYGSETTQLFDLENDPMETKNLAFDAAYQSICQRLAAEIDRHEATLDNVDLPANLTKRT